MKKSKSALLPSVEEAVVRGFSTRPKYLPSWLFYDDAGSALFREIMELPEYYLTAAENEILQTYSDAIASNLRALSRTWDIVELGAGDGSKSAILLEAVLRKNIDADYYPIDVSSQAHQYLENHLKDQLPGLRIHPVNADYISGLRELAESGRRPRLILFMGANIGNFELHDAGVFLKAIASSLRNQDSLVVGFDLMKSPSVIEKAYHDYKGVTSHFNKNILIRLNRELEGNFNIRDFEHWCMYDAVTGACRSYLVSTRNQTVTLRKINLTTVFRAWETICTEVSQKYTEEMIFELARVSNLSVERIIYDTRRYFCLVFFKGNIAN